MSTVKGPLIRLILTVAHMGSRAAWSLKESIPRSGHLGAQACMDGLAANQGLRNV